MTNEKIKIAQIIGNAKSGGVSSCVMNYYRTVDKEKFQFDFFTYGASPYDDEIKALGGNVYYIPNIINFPKAIIRLYKIFKKNNYYAVHSHVTSLSVFPLFAAKLAKVKYRICHAHSTTYKAEKVGFVKNFLKHFSTLFATHIAGCGMLSIKWLYGQKKAYKAFLLPNAIDLSRFKFNAEQRELERKKLGIENNFVIGNIGRFEYQKNHNFLIDVFHEFNKIYKDSKLILIGKGSLKSKIIEKIKSLNILENVLFLDEIHDVEKYYNIFDTFCLTSFYEGLPLVAVEAQANGLPCLMSDEITTEVNINERCEFLPITDIKPWVEKLTNFYNNHERYDDIKKLKESGFDILDTAKLLENFYLSLDNPKGKGKL